MPIETSVPIQSASLDESRELRNLLMGHARQVHADYGGMLHDEIYKAEITRRCAANGLGIEREVLLRVTHGTFFKDCRIDLLVERKYLVELKAVERLTREHSQETVHYLRLAGLSHGSLINCHGSTVLGRSIATQHDLADRRKFVTQTGAWPADDLHAALHEVTVAFCRDVGLDLDVALYRAAIANLIGGPTSVIVNVPVLDGTGQSAIGSHPMHLLTEQEGLAVTDVAQTRIFRNHLRRLVKHTALQSFAWINLRPNSITFEQVT